MTYSNKLLAFLCVLLFPLSAFAQKSLDFRKDGTFVVLQFNDNHFDASHKSGTDSTFLTMKTILERVRPDLVVLNGDVVTEKAGAPEIWKDITERMNRQKVYFAVTMGNHDAEAMPKSEIYDILESSPYYIGSRGPSSLSKSMGNCYVTLKGKDGKPKNVLYFLDSNDYHPNKFVQHYDWIHFDQIA